MYWIKLIGDKMKYNKKEESLSINLLEEELPFDGYFIGSRNYYRRIDDINPRQGKNGYGLIGTFEDKKDGMLFDDVLYLACCREKDKKDTYFLFTIKKGKPFLIEQSKAQKGAIRNMWDTIEEFLSKRPKASLQQLFNAVIELETDLRTLEEFSIALHSYSLGKEFDNQYSLPKKV